MRSVIVSLALLFTAACGGPTGELTVQLAAEEAIPEGLDPGTGPEDLVDGWTVRFERYVVALGDVQIERSADGLVHQAPAIGVYDLTGLPAGGVEIARFEAIDTGRYDRVSYAIARPDASSEARADAADVARMIENGWTHLIAGTLEKAGGESCPGGACRDAPSLRFEIGASVATAYGPCEAEEGLSGITVTEGGTLAEVSIHGDHLFFDAFPSGAEVIERRAQWLADADLDGDDTIDGDELRAAPAASLFPSALYNLAGAPIPIETGMDFARAQLTTQGHFQGEGECPWSLSE